MTLNLEAALATPPVKARSCKFGPWLMSQSPEDVTAVAKALANQELETRHIFRTLKAAGCPSAESSIRAHRARSCQYCEREFYGQP